MPDENEKKVVTEEVDEAIDLESEIELGDSPTEDEKDKAIKTLKAQKDHWRKKATDPKPEVKPEEKKEVQQGDALSTEDLYALMNNKVAQEDIAEVKDYAKLKGISISEALKSPIVKTILETNEEARTVAQATNTGKTAKTQTGISDEELLSNAKKGQMPESDADMDRLIRLRTGKKN